MQLTTLFAQAGKLRKEVASEPTHKQLMAAVEIAIQTRKARLDGQTDIFGEMNVRRALNFALKDQPGKGTFLIDPRY